MRRSFVLAFVLLAVAPRLAAAQAPPPKPVEIPVQISNAAAGTVVEFFLNDGKKGEVLVDISGTSGFVLDMGNSGKTKLTVYVDVCKDGKIVKVIFAAGEPPPKDDNCNRKLVAAGFYNDCGITRVTIDVSKLLGKVVGCGGIINTKTLVAVGGGLAGVVALTAGGGGSTTTPTAASPPPVTTTTPTTTTTAPPTSTAPPSTPPSSTPPSTATGNYICAACAVQSDPSRHDPTLRVCSGVTSTFGVAVGSLTIRHPTPFIEVSGANYNAETGAFDLTGRGSIAGFSNVSVRAVGTVNNSTGRITMSYTMGTGGEFPGGQPITYSMTLQKQ